MIKGVPFPGVSNSTSSNASNGSYSPAKYFRELIKEHSEMSIPVAAIKALSEIIPLSQATTMSEFIREVEDAVSHLKSTFNYSVPLLAGCELFLRFVTRTATDVNEFEACKQRLYERAASFAEKSHMYRERVVSLALPFIQDGSTILVHSYSRVVMLLLQKAAAANRRFRVIATEARPANLGLKMVEGLKKCGIPVTFILDAMVGYYMGKVDMVLVGAEGFVENGGLINQIGTYLVSVMAKEANKPFYAIAESYKFVRLFPLNQYDFPANTSNLVTLQSNNANSITATVESPEHQFLYPSVDFTPPNYITLLFTDIGILTPSGVSDELIKLYY